MHPEEFMKHRKSRMIGISVHPESNHVGRPVLTLKLSLGLPVRPESIGLGTCPWAGVILYHLTPCRGDRERWVGPVHRVCSCGAQGNTWWAITCEFFVCLVHTAICTVVVTVYFLMSNHDLYLLCLHFSSQSGLRGTEEGSERAAFSGVFHWEC